MRILMATLVALAAALPAHAAETFKCRDARGGITYSNESCEKQGLTDAGPVRERVMTLPAVSPAGKASPKDEKRRSEKDERPAK